MAITRRGKTLLTFGVIVGAIILFLIVRNFGGEPPVVDPRPPEVTVTNSEGVPMVVEGCPLTGEAPPDGGEVPDRPALAIKVENSVDARPQYGLDAADIVYEQPVEGGITRFIVIYQCQDARRVEPVRSARTSDPPILMQYGEPLFAYAAATKDVMRAVEKTNQIHDVNWLKVEGAYHVDSAREEPHDIYTDTRELWDEARRNADAPLPVFTYGDLPTNIPSKAGRKVHTDFSSTSDVWWKFQEGVYKRYHGNEPHLLAGQDQITSDNVLVQVVKITHTGRKDPNGQPIPEVVSVGKGKAYLFRDGQLFAGIWKRQKDKDLTFFGTRSGEEFVFKPGNTWIELYPSTAPKLKG